MTVSTYVNLISSRCIIEGYFLEGRITLFSYLNFCTQIDISILIVKVDVTRIHTKAVKKSARGKKGVAYLLKSSSPYQATQKTLRYINEAPVAYVSRGSEPKDSYRKLDLGSKLPRLSGSDT